MYRKLKKLNFSFKIEQQVETVHETCPNFQTFFHGFTATASKINNAYARQVLPLINL